MLDDIASVGCRTEGHEKKRLLLVFKKEAHMPEKEKQNQQLWENMEKQHARGKLYAAERLALLFDDNQYHCQPDVF